MATQAPIKLHGLDGRYATSLWKVASEQGQLPAVEKDLAGFKSVMGSEAVQQLLTNPSIPKNSKQDAIGALMEKSKFADSTKNFFKVLAENGRLAELEGIMGKFDELQRAAKGEVHAQVTVAEELTAAQTKALEKSLKSFMAEGSKMSLSVTVKPEILGGLVIDVGDKHINMSILQRIQQLSNLLKQPI
jgi:F-type H+-transporting ATPase subunit O